jgi:NADP-dependent 3-hydroxy acid dehydrogenase YdfG
MTRRRLALALGAGTLGTWLAVRALRARFRYDLRGKVVLITGGSRGLGLVLARQIAQEGARLAICACDSAELKRAAQELAAHGGNVLAVTGDLKDRNQVQRMIDQVRRGLGPVDVLAAQRNNELGDVNPSPLAHSR